MQIQFLKAIITKDIALVNQEERIFEGIATAEMIDKQGEITVRDALLRIFLHGYCVEHQLWTLIQIDTLVKDLIMHL